MALTSQIEAAARIPGVPVGGSDLNHESPLLTMARSQRAEEQLERRRAVAYVRRMAPADAAVILDALGLDGASGGLVPATAHKQCTRCREVKPLDAFPFRSGARDRRCSHCRDCKASAKRAAYAQKKEAGQ